MQVDEESSLASNAKVDLNSLFSNLTFASGEELTLSAGQPLSKVCSWPLLKLSQHRTALKLDTLPADSQPTLKITHLFANGGTTQGFLTGVPADERQYPLLIHMPAA